MFIEDKIGRKRMKAWPAWWSHVYALLVVIVGQAIYYSEDLRRLGSILVHMSGIGMITHHAGFVDIATWTSLQNNLFLIIAAIAACFPIVPKLRAYFATVRSERVYSLAKIGAAVHCVGLLIICTIMLSDSTNSPFLYWNY